MPPTAPYDEIADWYENEFLTTQRSLDGGNPDPLGIAAALEQLLGKGSGACLEIGCGTGIHGNHLSAMGWTPVGIDLSSAMLQYARGRLPVGLGDAERLPIRSGRMDAVISVMVHTDMPAYLAVLDEVWRVLRPGGIFVHVGVHPCFCGGFADGADPAALVIRPGYLDGHWTKKSWTSHGLRDKVGASHWPLPALLNAFANTGSHD